MWIVQNQIKTYRRELNQSCSIHFDNEFELKEWGRWNIKTEIKKQNYIYASHNYNYFPIKFRTWWHLSISIMQNELDWLWTLLVDVNLMI